MSDLQETIARAIHDGPTAQRHYAAEGVAPHGWDECPFAVGGGTGRTPPPCSPPSRDGGA